MLSSFFGIGKSRKPMKAKGPRPLAMETLENRDLFAVAPIIFTDLPKGGLKTSEDGGSAQFSIVLTRQPTADVAIDLHAQYKKVDTDVITLDKNGVEFTPLNWNVPQTITVTGQDDGKLFKKAFKFTIVTEKAVSDDPAFTKNLKDLKVTNAPSTDIARFDGHFVGDFTATITRVGKITGQLDATVVNGVVTLNQLTLSNIPQVGTITASGTGLVTEPGQISIKFDNNSGLLSGETVSGIPIVSNKAGVPLLKGTANFSVPDFGVTVKLKLNIVST